MTPEKSLEATADAEGIGTLLAASGYSPRAIRYFLEKPYLGELPGANVVGELTGTCGDTMRVWLRVEEGLIREARYQVLGCPGAVAAAMALVDLIRGKSVEAALKVHDGDVFRLLEAIPAQKNHCIELAVKTLQKALKASIQQKNPSP